VYNSSTNAYATKLSNCTIQNNGTGITVTNARLDIVQTDPTLGVKNNSGYGIMANAGGTAYMESVYVTGNTNYGIKTAVSTGSIILSPNYIGKGYNHILNNVAGQAWNYAGGMYIGEKVIECVCENPDESSILPGNPSDQSPSANTEEQPECMEGCSLGYVDHAGYNYFAGTYTGGHYWVKNDQSPPVMAVLTYWGSPATNSPPTAAFSGNVDRSYPLTGGGSVTAIGGLGDGSGSPIVQSITPSVNETAEFIRWVKYLKEQIRNETSNAIPAIHILSSLAGPRGKFASALGVGWDSYLTNLMGNARIAKLKSLSAAYRVQAKIDQRNYDDAITLAQSLIASSPDDELWFYCNSELVLAYEAKGDLTSAEASYSAMQSRGQSINSEGTANLRQILDHARTVGTGSSAQGSGNSNDPLNQTAKTTSSITSQNFPNPFNPQTVISYNLPENSLVQLKVYDILGREVATLVNEFQEAGLRTVSFDAASMPSGVYFYRINAGKFSEVKKMLLMK
jgi:hypothetical protein